MCGRFSATNTFREIKIRWNLQGDFFFEPRYNIAPSQSVPVIIQGGRGFDAKLMKWGLVPSWSKDPSVGNRMINARAETLLEKPSFRDLVERRRCVIPADGFMSGGGINAFGSVVMIVKEWSASPAVGWRQESQRPAKTNGSLLFR